MSDLNQCNFIGRLGRDPEMRFMPNGDACANFSIAVSEKWKDKSGEKKESTEWIRCVAWRQLAEIIEKHIHKGSLVYVSGKLKTRKWQDSNGVEKQTTEIIVNTLQMLGGKDRAEEPAEKHAQEPQRPPGHAMDLGKSQSPAAQSAFDDMTDDIPF